MESQGGGAEKQLVDLTWRFGITAAQSCGGQAEKPAFLQLRMVFADGEERYVGMLLCGV